MSDIVYLNGRLVPGEEAGVSPFDYGFLYGYGLFETMRAYSGRVFRLEQHLARLDRGAHILGLADKIADIDLTKAIYDVLRANNMTDARIRLTISAGEGAPIGDLDTCGPPTVFIMAAPVSAHIQEAARTGYKAVISQMKQPVSPAPAGVKSLCYMRSVMAKLEAKRAGADEALLLNDQGYLAEGTTCNVFLIKEGRVITPSLDCGILPGVTRDAVLEVCASRDIPVDETTVSLAELQHADEAFLTSAVIEIMPMTVLDGKPVGDGRPGPVTGRLMAGLRSLVVKETSSISLF